MMTEYEIQWKGTTVDDRNVIVFIAMDIKTKACIHHMRKSLPSYINTSSAFERWLTVRIKEFVKEIPDDNSNGKD